LVPPALPPFELVQLAGAARASSSCYFGMYPHPSEVVKLPTSSYTPAYTPTSTYAASTYLSPTRRYSPRGASGDDDVSVSCVRTMRTVNLRRSKAD